MCAAVSSYSQETRRELSDFLNEIRLDTNLVVKHVSLYGAASPGGSDLYNRKLAQERLAALESLLLGTISLEDGLIHKHADVLL